MSNVIQGEDKNLTINIESKGYDITTATEITACFVDKSSTVTTKTLTGGQITVNNSCQLVVRLEETDTDAMPKGTVDLELTFDVSGEKTKTQLKAALNIIEKLC